MANSKIQLFVFGDQTENSVPELLGLLRTSKVFGLLADFFVRCSNALRNEISALNSVDQDQFPKFNTINELVDNYHQRCSHNDVITGVLVCLTQLGCFIRYVDIISQAGDLKTLGIVINTIDHRFMEATSHSYSSPDTVYVGLCTGLLSAAAIATSKSLTHLVTIAVNVVRICFRVGLMARRRAQQLEAQNCTRDSWSMLVANLCASEARSLIEASQKEQVCIHIMTGCRDLIVSNENIEPRGSIKGFLSVFSRTLFQINKHTLVLNQFLQLL
jgi:naphtho-gamma-pyrone polyketide synthase